MAQVCRLSTPARRQPSKIHRPTASIATLATVRIILQKQTSGLEFGIMEVADRENYLGEGVIEAYSQKSNDIDEQEDHYASASSSKSQFRKVTLKARWSDETGMAEVVDKKGTIWRTTGIVRSSKLYFSIEEVLGFASHG